MLDDSRKSLLASVYIDLWGFSGPAFFSMSAHGFIYLEKARILKLGARVCVIGYEYVYSANCICRISEQ